MQNNKRYGVTRVQRLFRVSDPKGLHARVATVIAGVATQFEAEMLIQRGQAVASGRSLLGMLTLCAGPGELLTVVTKGIDADQAMRVLEGLFRRHALMVNA